MFAATCRRVDTMPTHDGRMTLLSHACVKVLRLLVVTVLVSTTARAQEAAPEVDRLFDWVTATSPGCSVSASLRGMPVLTRTYGLADLERDVPITPASVFDAGSVVKQFVAAATLLLVQDGRLSLTADIHTYLPELPDYGRPITIDHLMTHTSGIRDWTGVAPLAARTVDALTLTLRQRELDFAPGEEWSYSNGGYVLLKEIVARTSGMSFGDVARIRLFDPLGMTSTAYVADLRRVVKHRALAYDKAGSDWRLEVQFDNDRGGGGALLSTPADLLRWNQALFDRTLGEFVTGKLQEPARLANGRGLGYGRGLFLDAHPAGPVQWHSGGAAGYGTFLARFPEHGFSVATMCNAGDAAQGSAYARRLFELYVPAAGARAADNGARRAGGSGAPAPADVSGRAGLFFSEGARRPLRLAIDKGQLRVAGGPVLESTAVDRFRVIEPSLRVLSGDRFELHFVSADEIVLTSMEGATTRYRRARPGPMTPDAVKALAGRYGNDETRAVLDVAADPKGLRVRFNEQPPVEFTPVDVDIFQRGGMVLRVRRHPHGTAQALEYGNPVVRSVTFTRSGEALKAR